MTTFKLRTVDITDQNEAFRGHPFIRIMNDDTVPQLYCGYSHCKGKCGYPALMLTHPTYGEMKAHSSMVASGPVFQQKEWHGSKVQVLDLIAGLDPDICLKMWWY